jgi:predicted DNA-binding ArsR family transcriptional regulator
MENVITRESTIFTDLISKIIAMETEVELMRKAHLSCSNQWMNGEEVTQKLGVSKRTLQNYRDNRILPYSIVGGKFYYSFRDIEDMMMKNYIPSER